MVCLFIFLKLHMFLKILNYGEIYITKFIILIICKCTVQWQLSTFAFFTAITTVNLHNFFIILNWNYAPWNNSDSPLPPAFGNHYSAFSEFDDLLPHVSAIIQFLSFFSWLIVLNMMSLGLSMWMDVSEFHSILRLN